LVVRTWALWHGRSDHDVPKRRGGDRASQRNGLPASWRPSPLQISPAPSASPTGFHSGIVHINDQTVLYGVYGPIGGLGDSGNGFGYGTVSNADLFSEWQWIMTRSQIPTYLF
jgi:hypothetical protein